MAKEYRFAMIRSVIQDSGARELNAKFAAVSFYIWQEVFVLALYLVLCSIYFLNSIQSNR